MANIISLLHKVALGALLIDAVIELGFITSMVSWLHNGPPNGVWAVNFNGGTYEIAGTPLHMLVNQGHTSNGAAGTALVLIALLGFLVLAARHFFPRSRPLKGLYYFWLVLNVPALMLTIAALGYTFAITNQHRGQTIDQSVASTIDGRLAQYPLDAWTPQNWFPALLQLDLADPAVRSDIRFHLHIMRGWQYNLIPLFIVQLVETVLAFADAARRRRDERYGRVDQQTVEVKA